MPEAVTALRYESDDWPFKWDRSANERMWSYWMEPGVAEVLAPLRK